MTKYKIISYTAYEESCGEGVLEKFINENCMEGWLYHSCITFNYGNYWIIKFVFSRNE